MKQFQCKFPNGSDRGYTLDEVKSLFPLSVAAVLNLAVGEQAVDRDGDTWTRFPDIGSEAAPARDERLERIATAVLAGLAAVPNTSCKGAQEIVDGDVDYALRYARTLIAKLDAAK